MTTHSDKALATFAALGTQVADWFHPAVKWEGPVERMVPGHVTCPTCHGNRWVRLDAAGQLIPLPPKPVFNKNTYSYTGQSELHAYLQAAKSEHAKHMGWPNAGYAGNCPTCRTTARRSKWGGGGTSSTGTVPGLVKAMVMVGTIVWPKGTQFGKSRFGNGNVCTRAQCEVCGKGIPSGRRVPLAYEKDGKAYAMWAGEDCARKFSKVATLKPSKQENPKGLEAHLADNLAYVVKG